MYTKLKTKSFIKRTMEGTIYMVENTKNVRHLIWANVIQYILHTLNSIPIA
jgi:hypothetical protein